MKQMNHLPEVESLRSCTERHYNCAQSLLVPFRDVTGLSREESDRLGMAECAEPSRPQR